MYLSLLKDIYFKYIFNVRNVSVYLDSISIWGEWRTLFLDKRPLNPRHFWFEVILGFLTVGENIVLDTNQCVLPQYNAYSWNL